MWGKRILYAGYFWGAIALSLLIYMPVVMLVRFMTWNEHIECIVGAFLQLISATAFWGIVMYRDGYHNKHPFGKEEWLIHLIAFTINIIGGAFFKYAVYTSGGAYWMTVTVWLQTGHEWEGIGTAPLWLHAAFMLLCDCVYLVFGWLFYRWGRRKRASDREKLIKENETDQEKN